MLQVKICGNYLAEDLEKLATVQEKVDYIGFIFTPMSKRYVSAWQVALWMKKYPFLKDKATAVFLNQEKAEIDQVLAETGIKQVQLHGHEPPELCSELKEEHQVHLWKVIPVEEETIGVFQPYLSVADHFLLDTKMKGQSGGTGAVFNWSLIPRVLVETQKHGIPLWIAGGIKHSNVKELTTQYAIQGVDVASGVEGDKGKDLDKIKALIKGVQQHAASR